MSAGLTRVENKGECRIEIGSKEAADYPIHSRDAVLKQAVMIETVFSYLDTKTLSRCSQVSMMFRRSVTVAQRRNLSSLFPEWLKSAVGGDQAFSRLPICHIVPRRFEWQVAGGEYIDYLSHADLPGQVTIGMERERPYLAIKSVITREGRCCSSLITHRIVQTIALDFDKSSWVVAGDGPLQTGGLIEIDRVSETLRGFVIAKRKVAIYRQEYTACCGGRFTLCNKIVKFFKSCFFMKQQYVRLAR